MALILAIEPDKRQAAQLTRLVQARVGAELVLAATTEQALGAIGNRVPDLVLVPALLAPQDDATLATALRVIAATAHVQMLTIPVLGPASRSRQPLGVLARWRSKRAESPAPDGCDPDVFGDQIAAYLAEAAAERAINQSDREMDLSTLTTKVTKGTKDAVTSNPGAGNQIAPMTAAELAIVAAERFMVAEAAAAERAIVERNLSIVLSTAQDAGACAELQAAPVEELLAVAPAIAASEAFTVVELAATPDLAAASSVSKPLHVSEPPWFPQRRWPDLEGEPVLDAAALEDTADADAYTEFLPAVVLPSIELPAVLAASTERVAIVEMPIGAQDARPAIDMVPFEDPAPDAAIELWMPLSLGSTRSWPSLEGAWSEARPDPPLVVHAEPPAVVRAAPPAVSAAARASSPAPEPVPPPDAPAARPEWIELIESLRQDVKRLRSERTQAPVVGTRGKTPAVSRPLPPLGLAAGGAGATAPKKRAQSGKPAQDEWGFFDPEQCGFAALLAKLDEITQINDAP